MSRFFSMKCFWLSVLLLELYFIEVRLESREECNGKIMRTNNDGSIYSHNKYGKAPYPSNQDCVWFLQAPFENGILLTITSLDLEQTSSCTQASLQFFSGFTINHDNPIKVLCGSVKSVRFVYTRNQLTIRFKSSGNNFEHKGFQLRYAFSTLFNTKFNLAGITAHSSNVTYKINNSIVATNMTGNFPTQDALLFEGSSCYEFEATCRTQDKCLYKEFFCDGIKDCPDGSDEDPNYCSLVGVVRQRTGACYTSQIRCSSGECIPQRYWCDNQTDCQDGSDEAQCSISPPATLSTTNASNASHTANDTAGILTRSSGDCSNQFIQPLLVPDRIVGGTVARQGSWPWIISLRFMNQHICGGSIIASQWVLTASHCVYNRNQPAYFQVHAGRWTVNGNDGTIQAFRVQYIIMNPNYNPTLTNNDVALIKIAGSFTWNNYVQPVCLPNGNQDTPSTSSMCYATGWGDTKGTGGEGYLKQVRLPIVNHNQCAQIYGSRITQQMMCAGNLRGGADACQGDSGGPFVCMSRGKFRLTGVTSWGAGCAQPMQPGVYANVVMFNNWIAQVVNSY